MATTDGAGEPAMTPISLLLIEDDPGDALLLEEVANDAAITFDLTWVPSLAAARVHLAAGQPDCIILDLNLPDTRGLDGVAAVQRCAYGVPVIVMTGLAEEQSGLAAVAEGAQDYLVKGTVDGELLSRAVRYSIGRKRTELASAALQLSEHRSRENARLERGLLPIPLLRNGQVDVVTRYRAGRVGGLLGGDFFDVVECEDGTAHLLIGDVCGHGADEAALGVGLRIAWRTLVLGGVDAEDSMRILEEVLVAERPRSHVFATVTSVVLHADRTTMEIVRAGHPGIMLRTPTDVQMLEVPGGPALGLMPGRTSWKKALVETPESSAVVMFTDGLFEARVSTEDRLGEERLLDYARTCRTDADGDQFVDALIGHVETLSAPYGGLGDDIAVLHVRWSGKREVR